MDIATARGISLEAVVQAMSRAALGNVGALGRLGIATKDAAGDTLTYEQILAQAAHTMGGAAAAAAETLEGRMRRQQIAWDELSEQIGTALLPVSEAFLTVAEKMVPELQKMGPALGSAAVAAAQLVEALSPLFTGAVGKLPDVIEGVAVAVNSFINVGAGLAAFGAEVVTLGKANTEGLQQAARAAAAANDLIEATRNIRSELAEGRNAADAWADSVLFMAQTGSLTADTLRDLTDAADLTVDDVRELSGRWLEHAAALGLNEEQLADTAAIFREVSTVTVGGARNVGEAAKAFAAAGEDVDEFGDEVEESGEQAESAAQRIGRLADELKAQADPVFGAVRAWKSYQELLAQVDADGQRTSEELVELAEAVLDTQAALSALDSSTLTGGLDAIARALGVSREEAERLLDTLGVLDGKTVTSIINVEEVVRRASDTYSGTSGRTYTGRQHGGPVEADMPYLVGERGPELFVPRTPGAIIPSGSFGGRTVTVNQTIVRPETSSLDRDLAYGALLAGLMTQVVA
jgi:hypothetical protein